MPVPKNRKKDQSPTPKRDRDRNTQENRKRKKVPLDQPSSAGCLLVRKPMSAQSLTDRDLR
jgi:hypothetical protein